jgi:uncharacterized membrane protein YkoI
MPHNGTHSRRITTLALLGGGIAAGVIGATAIGASAQSDASTATTAATSAPTAPSTDRHPGNGETAVTGSKATELKAAAVAKVPGGTVESVTTDTDYTGAAYEVHVTKSDGTEVEVLFDANLAYVTTQTNTGPGGRGGHGGGGNGETPVTGANAATLKAAALKQVPGATVEEVSTDSGDAAYEVHLKKADGTEVTAKFDKDLAFIAIEDGRGK